MSDISKAASFFGITLPGAKKKEALEAAVKGMSLPKVGKGKTVTDTNSSSKAIKAKPKDTSKADRASLVNSLGTRVNPLIAQDKAKSSFAK